jgi:hypothetical protein
MSDTLQWLVGTSITLIIVLWLLLRDMERQSKADAARNYYMQKMAHYREDLENYRSYKAKYEREMHKLRLIRKQCADAQNDEGLLPTHTVGKILGWGLPRQTAVSGATARDTVLGSVIGDVTYGGYGRIGDHAFHVDSHPFPSPVIKGFFRANHLIQWIEGIMLSKSHLLPREPQEPSAPAARRKRWV